MIGPELVAALVRPADPALTVYGRFDPEQRDLRAPETALRRIAEEAEAQLVEHGCDEETRRVLLAPLARLASADLAGHRDPGFAVFVRRDWAEVVRLPAGLDELVVVGQHFHVKPLLPLITRNRRFHVLALSSTRARLVTATAFSWEERALEAVPDAVQAELDSMPARDPAAQAAERMRIITGDPHLVAGAVRAALGPDAGPVVLAAEPQVAGNFIKVANLPGLLDETVLVNPFALDDEDLKGRVLAVVEPLLDEEVDRVIEQVEARLGTGESNVAIRLEEILAAGVEGRVEAVVVASDETLWGRYTPGKIVAADGHRAPGDEDLINLAAAQAMATGARAYARPKAGLPRGVPAVATLRF